LVLGWDVDKKLRNGLFLASNGLKLKSNRSKSLLSDGLRRPVSSVRHEHAQHRADSHIRREHQGQEVPDQNLGVPFTAGKPNYNVSSPYYSARKILFGLRTPGFLCMTMQPIFHILRQCGFGDFIGLLRWPCRLLCSLPLIKMADQFLIILW
jgi:hypothetical protein